MCGIFCACTSKLQEDAILPTVEEIKVILKRRGPDYQGYEVVNHGNHTLFCVATVLWMQGKKLTKQPICDDQSLFMYNGDIFGGMEIPEEGDTTLLHSILKESSDFNVLLKIEGPYSFIYLDKKQSKLHFCRDVFGRRSLLVGYKDHTLIVSSAAKRSLFRCIELPAIGVFTYDLETEELVLTPWKFKHPNFLEKIAEIEEALSKSVIVIEKVEIERSKFFQVSDADIKFLEQLSHCKNNEIFNKILDNPKWLSNVQHLKDLLQKAIKVRVKEQVCCQNCHGKTTYCDHCTVGVLFSGGIDCTVLTLLLDHYLDEKRPIDLLNVAFNANAPDRQTGLSSLKELERLRPNRIWNFLELNVHENELNTEREKSIADLIFPLNTILDESLGCALWFASRGQTENYTSTCRVLIVGTGADELFGGYTKHRASLKHSGWEGLHSSLEQDWQNISFRNLARDDRVISDHGRQSRAPYLDEKVVEFVRSLNCSEKTCPSDFLPQGVGEKILLRTLAYYLGLENVASLKKRALQFGSRIANNKENANAISPRL